MKREYGFEVWSVDGTELFAFGKARNPGHAVALMRTNMANKPSLVGCLVCNGDVVQTYSFEWLFEE